jgi:ribonucleotide reductase beta subunit family protein with ferritin-like domain
LYKKLGSIFWLAENVDYKKDEYDFKALAPPMQHFIQTIVAYFAFADGLVNFNLLENFTKVRYDRRPAL